jgi:hypothetical protein
VESTNTLTLRVLDDEKQTWPKIFHDAHEKKAGKNSHDNEAKKNSDNEIPHRHTNHHGRDRDIFHPGIQPMKVPEAMCIPEYLVTRCLVSQRASLTRSIPKTNIRAPTTITAIVGPIKIKTSLAAACSTDTYGGNQWDRYRE